MELKFALISETVSARLYIFVKGTSEDLLFAACIADLATPTLLPTVGTNESISPTNSPLHKSSNLYLNLQPLYGSLR